MPEAPYPVEPDDHRRARHLHVLKTLSDRGFTLALKAADRAEAELDTPEPPTDEPPRRPPARPTFRDSFQSLARLVRLLVTAEHRIANGTARRPWRALADGPPDPRRAPLRQIIHTATRHSPDRAELRRDAFATLDDGLARDPARHLPAAQLLHEVCDRHGLPFDPARLPDQLLEPIPLHPP